eukprot:367441-Pelagomonas_calceolata.AAC.2
MQDYYYRDITKLIRHFVNFIEKLPPVKIGIQMPPGPNQAPAEVKAQPATPCLLSQDDTFREHFFLLVRDLVGFVEQDDALQKNVFVLVKELIKFISKDDGFKEDIAAIIIKFVGFIEKVRMGWKLCYMHLLNELVNAQKIPASLQALSCKRAVHRLISVSAALQDYSFQKLVFSLVKDIYAYYVEQYKQDASYKQGVYAYLCSVYEYLAGSKVSTMG